MSSIKILTITLLITSILFGCTGNRRSEVAKVKPEKTDISGDLSGYLQVVDNEYEVSENYGGHLSIKVKALKPYDANELTNKTVYLIASLLDDNGIPISGAGKFFSEGNDQLLNLLRKGSGEEVINMAALMGQYRAEDQAEKSKKFIVSSEFKEVEQEQEKSSKGSENSISPNNSSSTSGSTNWDKVLDDYENYVDSYLRLLEKAKSGDNSAVQEYLDVLKESTNLQMSLLKAKQDNNLSLEQAGRLNTLMLKLGSGMKK